MASALKRQTQLELQRRQQSDRRAARRYRVQTPLRYRTAGSAIWKKGRTLDMSASGILVDIPDVLAAGTKLEFAMDWTGLYHGRQTMRLCVIAAVRRTDARGTAVRILGHRFRDERPAAVRPQTAERNLAVA